MTNTTLCVSCFKSLGVPTKHHLFTYLKKTGGSTVGELVNYVGLKQPTVSFHLSQMVKSGLLTRQRSGKFVRYSISDQCPKYNKDCVLKDVQLTE